jgi:hypothetical protein
VLCNYGYEKLLPLINHHNCMKKRKEVSLLGALVICAVALAVHSLLKLGEPKNAQ